MLRKTEREGGRGGESEEHRGERKTVMRKRKGATGRSPHDADIASATWFLPVLFSDFPHVQQRSWSD